MAAKAGRLILIQVEDDASPASYTTIGGMRSKTISINAEAIDITNDDSADWREILDGYGVRNVDVSGSGVLDAADTEIHSVVDALNSNTIQNFKLTIPGFKVLEGKFKVTATSVSGEHTGEATYDFNFMSSGEITFTDV